MIALSDFKQGILQPVLMSSKPARTWFLIFLSILITWFIYVPVHELLHVAGCEYTGGDVSELILGREYGADFLQHIFPVIRPQTSLYAGRVTGFEPNGDLGYFLTDLAPYLLTIFPGVWWLRQAGDRGRLWLTGPGIVVGLASFTNLVGDYFEMGTIVSTRFVNWVGSSRPEQLIHDTISLPPRDFFHLLRSDDIFRLFKEIQAAAPGVYGLDSLAGITALTSVITLGLLLAVLFAGWTYHAGSAVTWLLMKKGKSQ